MSQHDKTWQQLHQRQGNVTVSLRQLFMRNKRKKQNFAPQPIGFYHKQNIAMRSVKCVYLLLTTNYSLRLAWYQAAR